MDSKKPKMQTPSRPIGLSRFSPRVKLTPPIKRPNDQIPSPQTVNNAIASNNKESNDDLITPTKRRKLGRFVVNTKQTDDSMVTIEKTNESENNVKTIDDLKAEIMQIKMHLDNYDKYKAQKSELQRLIAVWNDGGRKALEMLQEEIKPEQEAEQILTHLHLPTDVFDDVSAFDDNK